MEGGELIDGVGGGRWGGGGLFKRDRGKSCIVSMLDI